MHSPLFIEHLSGITRSQSKNETELPNCLGNTDELQRGEKKSGSTKQARLIVILSRAGGGGGWSGGGGGWSSGGGGSRSCGGSLRK